MPDLSTNTGGIHSPNPFWLASAPPANSGLQIQRAFEAIPPDLREAAACCGMGPWKAFLRVELPLAWPGIVSAVALVFAHTLGEFGVVLMIGGNIPGQTRVVSTQIYGHVEAMEYAQAHWLAGGMLAFSFLVLLGLALLKRRFGRVLP